MPRLSSSPARRPKKTRVAEEPAAENVVASGRFRTPAFLRNREMSYAQLSGVDLSGSDFFGSRLMKASFAKSRLVGANFTQANLKGADFTGADLTDAILVDAMVLGARFDGAVGLTAEQVTVLARHGAVLAAEAPTRDKLAS
jgi:uncharacterized protein YjbI with pentapeptide repeats